MAESRQGARGGRRPAAEKRKREHAGWFVILRVDELGTKGEPVPIVGERLTVIALVKGKDNQGSDSIAREHRIAKETEWAQARAKGEHPDFPDGLPDHFPRHNYRAVALGSLMPGHYAEETRQAAFGTF
jgi:hypothetical protein